MSMAKMTPDKLNGHDILRPVVFGGDGIPKLSSSSVYFPPTIKVEHRVMSFEEMSGKLADHIVAHGAMTKTYLAVLLYNFARAVAQNEALKNG